MREVSSGLLASTQLGSVLQSSAAPPAPSQFATYNTSNINVNYGDRARPCHDVAFARVHSF